MNKKTASFRSKRNVFLVACVFLFFSFILVFRLVDMQVINGEYYKQLAVAQHFRQEKKVPERGKILASNGEILATTNYVYTIGVSPKDVHARKPPIKIEKGKMREVMSENLARILKIDKTEVMNALKKTNELYIVLKKDIESDMKEELEKFIDEYSVGGIAIDSNMKRFYPQNTLAPQLVGYANRSTGFLQGVLGIENSYNKELTGELGYVYSEVNRFTNAPLPYFNPITKEIKPGKSVTTYLNVHLQKYAQNLITRYADLYEAKDGGSVLVMDLVTGGIIVMAQSDNFDLNNPLSKPTTWGGREWDPNKVRKHMDFLNSSVWLNKNISYPYEPGSTFKAFTVATAIEENVFNRDEEFSDEELNIPGWDDPISSPALKIGLQKVESGFGRSINQIMAQLGMRVGVKTFYDYVRLLGFYSTTGIDLPNELTGLIHKNPNLIDLVSLTFGEQNTVTPIQLATAYTAFANKGKILKPQVVKNILDSDGRVIKEFRPEYIRQAYSAETANNMLFMLRNAVTNHLVNKANSPGFMVGAKTATSTSQPGGEEGRDQLAVTSVAAIFPINNPRYVVLTSLYNLSATNINTLGVQAFTSHFIREIGKEMEIKPQYTEMDFDQLFTPFYNNIENSVRAVDKRDFFSKNYVYLDFDKGLKATDFFYDTYPRIGSKMNGIPSLFVSVKGEPPKEKVEVVDFKDLTVFEAIELSHTKGLNISFEGRPLNQVVVGQNIPPLDEDGKTSLVPKWTIIGLQFGESETRKLKPIEMTKEPEEPPANLILANGLGDE